MDRAYSLLNIKSVNEETRVITGIASTPDTDRDGDILEPKGAVFDLPVSLLWQHNHQQPIGEVFAAEVTSKGISIQARIAKVDEPGQLKDLLDLAWQSIKAKLVKGLSVGYRPIEAKRIESTGGVHFLKWMWLELSAVTVPCNMHATIQQIKSLDMAASGRITSPGVTGSHPVVYAVKAATSMSTIAEQITSFENTRAAKSARMTDLMTKSDGSTLDASQSEEYDGLEREVESIDAHLVRLRKLEKSAIATATPIVAQADPSKVSDLRGGNVPIIQVKSNLPKGTAFTRMVMAKAAAKGDPMYALEIAKQWRDTTPEVEMYLKTAVAAGTTTDATWAAPLMPAAQALTGDFLELLRPATLLGKMPRLRKVPFNVAVTSQTAGGTYGWVGQGKPKPVTTNAFATVTLLFNKIAGIIVITEELAKFSTPSAEETIRQDMIAGIAGFMDSQFIDPSVAASGTVTPASITNGTSAITSSGTSADNAKTDIKALVATFVAANLSTQDAILIMSEANAFALGVAVNPLGQQLYPGLGAKGGNIMGIPVITSQAASTNVILVDQQGVLFADDGGVTIDVSREASVEMETPVTDPVVAATVMVSLWQQNLIGLRAERFCSWKRARTASVKYVSSAAYV